MKRMKKMSKTQIISVGILVILTLATVAVLVKITGTKKKEEPGVDTPPIVKDEDMDNINSNAKIIEEGGVQVF